MQPRSSPRPGPRRYPERSRPPISKSGFSFGSLLVILLIATLPSAALYMMRSQINWLYAGTYLALISLATYIVYGWDKWRARMGLWRFTESSLHLLELAGGWPAAFIAQKHFRHKTVKTRFQVIFWLIVIIYQLVAVDCLLQFRYTKAAAGVVLGANFSWPSSRPNPRPRSRSSADFLEQHNLHPSY